MSKIVVSSTPHVRSKNSIQEIMRDVIIALLPATAMGVYFFGLYALLIIAVTVASCVLAEYLYQKAMKKPITVTDLSAVVTGLLLALNLPPTVPLWLPVVGGFFAIIFAKQFFGGLGQNFINPALAGRAFLLSSYAGLMTDWVHLGTDATSAATPLAVLKDTGITASFPQSADFVNALIGNIGGCIGETSAIALILGGLYLLFKKVINWRIPVTYIGTVFVLTWVLGRDGFFSGVPHYEIFTGGLMLGAFFMATDYSSSPVTPVGQLIMGVGCGILTTVIRIYGGYPEGVSYSILLMNLAVPLIDRFTQPKIYGEVKKA